MTPPPATNPPPPRTDPERWKRADPACAFDHFSDPDPGSQRRYAQEHGIPRSTLGYWLRREEPADLDPQVIAFLRSRVGEEFLRRIVLAAVLTFQQQAACGIRPIGQFLRLAQLDPFVACSYGALHSLVTRLQTDLGRFSDEEGPRLAVQMTPRTITLAADENFHGPQACLVAIEPVSNFLVVECYRDHRDGDTWTKAIQEGLSGMHVQVVLLNSDLAKGLLRCAHEGLGVIHSPDLFHGQRDLLKPLLLPLQRPIQQAEKELEKAKKQTEKWDAPLGEVQTPAEVEALIQAVRHEVAIDNRLEEAKQRQERAVREVRGVGADYHPFDRHTGQPVSAEEVGKRLNEHVEELAKVVDEAELGENPQRAIAKARVWVATLMGCVAWFWGLVNRRVEELELSEEQERQVRENLLPGHYWEMAAGRARTAEERARLKEMAEELKKAAWPEGGALASLTGEERKEIERVAKESAGLFSRSSSCVEGRNGRLSLHQHGQGRLSAGKLKALTAVHNYVLRRADGTTAAERFFGVKPRDAFSWLLQRMPDLPLPAAKRPRNGPQATSRNR